jgi:prefoldin alpha subunit
MSDDSMQKLYVQQKFLEEHIPELESSISLLQDAIASYLSGKQVLEELVKRHADEPILIDIGGRINIEAKIVTTDKVLVSLGSGVRVEKSLEDAKSIMEKKIEELNAHLAKYRQEYEKSVRQYSLIRETQERAQTSAPQKEDTGE